MSDLLDWLTDLSLEKHHAALVKNGVDLSLVTELTEDDLRDLGFGLGDRKRFMIGQRRLRAPAREIGAPNDGESQERRQLSLMFVDLVGSTALSNRLDLEAYRETLHVYQKCCLDAIRERNGYVAQFLGDGVVAYFGYPVADEAAAEAAVLAGLNICEAIRDAETPAGERLDVRIGISTGDVLIDRLADFGEAGAGLALGDTPNLAARLQSAAAPGTVAISGATRELLGRNISTRSLGRRRFKGFAEEVEVWVVTGVHNTPLRFKSRHGEADTPLVDREDEVRTLDSRWRAARRGAGQVVCVTGEAGIGKSRLVDTLIERVRGEDAHIIGLQCSPYHEASAFFPVIALLTLSAGLRRSDGDAEKREKLEALLSGWGQRSGDVSRALAALLGIGGEGPLAGERLEGEEAKERLQNILIAIALELSRRRPLLLIFEDLHWIDPSSEELIERLIQRLPKSRMMLLCTYRTGYECPWEGMARVTTMPLTRLDALQSQTMVRNLVTGAGGALPAEVEQEIIARTEGVPLFVEEMVRMVRQRLAAPGVEERGLGSLLLPSTLKDLLRAQIDALPSAHDVMPVCAALGRVIHPALLAAVAGLEPDGARHLLEQLVKAKMLVVHGGGRDRTYSFRHAMILDVAYESMLPSRARALHRRIAGELTGAFADLVAWSPEVLARHYERADMPREARDAWRDAARLAASRWATKETLSHLQAALACNERAEGGDRDTAEIELRKLMVVALHHRGFASQAHAENYTRLSELMSRTGQEFDASLPFVTVHNQFGALLMRGAAAEARAMCGDIAAVADASGVIALQALAAHDRGMANFFMGEMAAATADYATSRELYARCAPEDVLQFYPGDLRLVDGAMSLWARSLSAGEPETRGELDAFAEELDEEPHLFSRCYALAVSAATYQCLGDAGRTLAAARRAEAISARTEFDYWSAWCRFLIGWARAMQGETGPGAAEIRGGIEAYVASGSAQMRLYAETLLADAYRSAGEVEEGLRTIETIRRGEREMTVRFQKPFTDRVEAALRAASP